MVQEAHISSLSLSCNFALLHFSAPSISPPPPAMASPRRRSLPLPLLLLVFPVSLFVVLLLHHRSSVPAAELLSGPGPDPRRFSLLIKVLAYDRPGPLRRCLRSLAAADYAGTAWRSTSSSTTRAPTRPSMRRARSSPRPTPSGGRTGRSACTTAPPTRGSRRSGSRRGGPAPTTSSPSSSRTTSRCRRSTIGSSSGWSWRTTTTARTTAPTCSARRCSAPGLSQVRATLNDLYLVGCNSLHILLGFVRIVQCVR